MARLSQLFKLLSRSLSQKRSPRSRGLKTNSSLMKMINFQMRTEKWLQKKNQSLNKLRQWLKKLKTMNQNWSKSLLSKISLHLLDEGVKKLEYNQRSQINRYNESKVILLKDLISEANLQKVIPISLILLIIRKHLETKDLIEECHLMIKISPYNQNLYVIIKSLHKSQGKKLMIRKC